MGYFVGRTAQVAADGEKTRCVTDGPASWLCRPTRRCTRPPAWLAAGERLRRYAASCVKQAFADTPLNSEGCRLTVRLGGAAHIPIDSQSLVARKDTYHERTKYTVNLDVKFGFLELIDVPTLVAASREQIYSQTLCQVNDSVVRLGVIQGELHWHKHDEEDEFFFVLQGKFLIDLEGKTVTLEPHQGYVIPKGAVHRTRAPQRTAVLMVEKSSVKPTGNLAESAARQAVKPMHRA